MKDTLQRGDYIAIVTLLCLCISFFIYVSVQEIDDRSELIYHESEESEMQKMGSTSVNIGEPVAKNALIISAKGSRYYYYAWCSGAKRIKNKVIYQSEDEAKQAGKVLSKSCK